MNARAQHQSLVQPVVALEDLRQLLAGVLGWQLRQETELAHRDPADWRPRTREPPCRSDYRAVSAERDGHPRALRLRGWHQLPGGEQSRVVAKGSHLVSTPLRQPPGILRH